jgi:hypothetical protein
VHRNDMSGHLSEEWRGRAACRDRPDLDFFPDTKINTPPPKGVRWCCESCPVREQCLQLALSVPEIDDLDGIFAGLTPKQRGNLRSHYTRTHNGRLVEDNRGRL